MINLVSYIAFFLDQWWENSETRFW